MQEHTNQQKEKNNLAVLSSVSECFRANLALSERFTVLWGTPFQSNNNKMKAKKKQSKYGSSGWLCMRLNYHLKVLKVKVSLIGRIASCDAVQAPRPILKSETLNLKTLR